MEWLLRFNMWPPGRSKTLCRSGWNRASFFGGIERIVSSIEDVLSVIATSAIFLLMFLCIANIMGAYAFSRPLLGYVELVKLAMVPIIFFGLSYTDRVGGQVRIDFLIRKLPGRSYVEFSTLLLSLFIWLIIGFSSLQWTLFHAEIGNATPILRLTIWPSELAVPIASFLLCARLLCKIIRLTWSS